MVFKVSKGGVRTGNTLRGLHSTKTKRYGRHACLLASTSLGRRDMARLIHYDGMDEQLVTDTLGKTDVLLSLNKQQRWRLPAIVGQMIKNGQFNKNATVSMLEKHKLKRRANCVSLVSNSSKTSNITPKQKKYFSFTLDGFTQNQSKREQRRERVAEMKKLKISESLAHKTIRSYTIEGGNGMTTQNASLFASDVPEYRLEVFYPCPKSCSLTYNPKYTDVVIAEGKSGEMEVKANRKTPKKGLSTHRKRLTSKDIDLLRCEETVQDDVDEMWEEECEDVETEENNMASDLIECHTTKHNLGLLLAQAEKTRSLLVGSTKSNGNKTSKKQRRRTFITPDNKRDKSHIFYIDRENSDETDVMPIAKNENTQVDIDTNGNQNLGPFFSRVILSNSEASTKELNERYGTLYTESCCQPRRFVLDITEDVSNLFSPSQSTTKEFNYTSYLVFTYDGFYDEGLASYKVAFSSMIGNKMNDLSSVLPFARHSISDIMNALFCHLLDLKEQNLLEFVKMRRAKTHCSTTEFLNNRISLTVNAFNPSQQVPRLSTSDTHGNTTKSFPEISHVDLYDDFSGDLDVDSFCDVCYVSVTPSKTDSMCATKLTACEHILCDDCWRSHFRTLIKEGKTSITCAGYDCDTRVDLVTLMSILNMSEISLLIQRQTEEKIEVMDNAKWCPYPECRRVIVVDSKWKDLSVDVICACGQQLCFSCFGPPHWPATCEQAEEYLEKLPTIEQVKDYEHEESSPHPRVNHNLTENKGKPLKVEGRLCPGCKRFIEKNGGCPQVVCKCGIRICWNCMMSCNGYCKPNPDYVKKYTRTLIIKHASAKKLVALEQNEGPQKIQKHKQKTTFYQRAMQHREIGTEGYRFSEVKGLFKKMMEEANKDKEFKLEIMKSISPSEDVKAYNTLDISDNLKTLLKSCALMKQELHRVIEFSLILLQGTPNSVTKQQILKLTDDLGGFCSFVRSIYDLDDKQDAKAAFRRLVDLQAWAKRALDALIRATSILRKE